MTAERGWVLCAGVNGCPAVVFDPDLKGALCDDCRRLADDAARDAAMEMS